MADGRDRRHSFMEHLWVRAVYLARHQGFVLASLLVAALGVWGFIEIADEVMGGDTHAFDEWVVRSLRRPGDPARPIGPRWITTAALDVTALGGMVVLFLITFFVGVFLFLMGKRHAMGLAWGATFTGALLSVVLKEIFDRPRPQVVPHLAEVESASFPSGHALMSAVVYLTLGALLSQFVRQRRVKCYVLGVAVLMTGIIGLSRIFLGVHYPTDVLAGWTVGLTWALLCWNLAAWLQSRGKVEPPGMEGVDVGGGE